MSIQAVPAGGVRGPESKPGGCEVYELGLGRRRPALTERQFRIGRLMATGAKDEAIARQLGLSARTVRAEITALVTGLGAKSRFQAGCLLVRRFG